MVIKVKRKNLVISFISFIAISIFFVFMVFNGIEHINKSNSTYNDYEYVELTFKIYKKDNNGETYHLYVYVLENDSAYHINNLLTKRDVNLAIQELHHGDKIYMYVDGLDIVELKSDEVTVLSFDRYKEIYHSNGIGLISLFAFFSLFSISFTCFLGYGLIKTSKE
jgi:ABC-type transport system involved in multi-copper enzyme maturation permease subunit